MSTFGILAKCKIQGIVTDIKYAHLEKKMRKEMEQKDYEKKIREAKESLKQNQER